VLNRIENQGVAVPMDRRVELIPVEPFVDGLRSSDAIGDFQAVAPFGSGDCRFHLQYRAVLFDVEVALRSGACILAPVSGEIRRCLAAGGNTSQQSEKYDYTRRPELDARSPTGGDSMYVVADY